ncbi:Transmembrane protein 237 [Trinorchestia longiramus]|nr:Transmembrane protein 237 [Trinorchestia longiramus]
MSCRGFKLFLVGAFGFYKVGAASKNKVMTRDDDDNDQSRPTSHSSCGRKRWEMHSKESFETSLAIETPSPAPRNVRNITSAKKSQVDLSAADVSKGSAGESRSRVKSAVRKTSALSRETSAEIKHAQKMAEGRRARGASAQTDKVFNERRSSKSGGRIPVPIMRSSSRNSKHLSSEDISGSDLSKIDDHVKPPRRDCPPTDALAAKHSSILNAANMPKQSRPSSQETQYTEESISREEGYETDDYKCVKVQEANDTDDNFKNTGQSSVKPSAPPLDDDYEKRNEIRNVDKDFSSKSSSSSPSDSHYKKKRRRSRKFEQKESVRQGSNSYINVQLQKLRDDIIDSTTDIKKLVFDDGQFGSHNPSLLPLPGLVLANTHAVNDSSSEQKMRASVSAIYCEKVHGFVLAKDWERYAAQAGLSVEEGCSERLHPNRPPSRASLAVMLQTSFRTFAVFAQGLLAGVSLAHCILVFLIAESWQDVTSALLPRLTHVFYALIIFLTLVCLVAACDRCDLCSGAGSLINHHSLHIPWSAGLYLASLAVTVATTRSTMLLALRLGPLPDPHQSGGIGWYAWMCLARTATNLLAWLAVVPDPHTDALLNKLNNSLQNLDAKRAES